MTGHLPNFTSREGKTLCTLDVPRVLEVRISITGDLAWLCLECGESVEPYVDKIRVKILSDEQLARSEDGEILQFAGDLVIVGEQRVPKPGEGDSFTSTLQEPVFWEPTDDSIRNFP